MQTQRIPTTAPDAIEQARQVLLNGGLVAFPTDTVYGIGALVTHPEGINRLFQAKTRAAARAVAVLIGDPGQLAQLTPGLSPNALRLAEHYWPGALTLVVPRHPDLPKNLSALPTLGVRMPDHPFALALLRRCGPLVTSSANLSGENNTLTAEQVVEQLDGRVELICDGGNAFGGVPSTVVDCTQEDPRILRQGAIPGNEILRWLGLQA